MNAAQRDGEGQEPGREELKKHEPERHREHEPEHHREHEPEHHREHEPEHHREHEPEHHHFEIQIDRAHYKVTLKHMTGLQLRHVPTPPIGADRDLFEVVPGGSDRKIGDEEAVEIRNGLRFFTAPAQINPGMERPNRGHDIVTVK